MEITPLIGRAVTGAIRSALPLISRMDNQQIAALIPPIPVPVASEWRSLREIIATDAVLMQFLRHLARHSPDSETLRTRIETYIVNPLITGGLARRRAQARWGISGLSSISITPTVICNLHCDLCYNLTEIHRDPKETLSYEVMDKVMREGKDLGAYRYTFIGGEPLIRWQDIHALARRHADTTVTIITNGILLNEERARAFASLGNVELSFSVDGFAETHDRSRGEGTFAKVMEAMDLYRDAGGLFLYSPTVTSENYREIFSDEFIDLMAEKGCYMGYYHHYDMIGGQSRSQLMLEASELRWIDHRIKVLVGAKPVAIADQVLSRLVRGGCPAVRDFVHINHRGEVEPCCMVPFAASSVIDQPLVAALGSEFFQRLMDIGGDEHGVKRCLVGENTDVVEKAVGDGVAFGTTLASEQVFDVERPPGKIHPTCFAADAFAAGPAPRRARRRVRLPLLS